MAQIYSRNDAEKALKFWRKKLNEAIANERREDVDTMSAAEFFKDNEDVDEADLPTMEQTLEDEQDNEIQKYAPNTVGAVIDLLKKSDPNEKLLIRLLPDESECMLVAVSRTMTDDSEITMFDIAKGSPEE